MGKNEFTATEKKTLKSMFWRSGMVFSGFNMVKMEGNAFCATMAPVVNELYHEPEERKKALKRHNGFFNTHSVPFAFIAGLTYALEKEKMEKGTVDDDTIENIKVSLMGPTAGIGDAFFFNCLRIIAAGIAMGLAAQGSLLGPILFLLMYGGSQLIARWYLMKAGYTMGTTFIDKVFSSGLLAAMTKSASILGISMVGAMVANMVKVKMAWTIQIGETSVVVLDILNSVMPGILSVVLLFALVKLIKKGKKPITLVVGILISSILLAAVGFSKMRAVIYCDNIYMEDGKRDGYLVVEEGTIRELYSKEEAMKTGVKADQDFTGYTIIPGIFDTHNHGGFGVRVNDGCTEDEMKIYLKGLASTGVTSVFPTTFELEAMKLVSRMAQEEQDGAQILGIHSEGPWGARVGEKGVNTGYPAVDMNVAHQMVEAADGALKLVAIAPEVEGAGEAIDYFLSEGITMAIYHTNANYEEANQAIDRGITVGTHLGNVMTGLHHRDVGTMGACILRDEVDCELICDGLHVSLPMLKLIFKLKDHDRIMMVSDNVQYAGAPEGEYLREKQVENSDRNRIFVTADGQVVSQNGRLSGSSKPVIFGMKNLVQELHMPLEEVVRFSSANPCRKYGFYNQKGSLKVGKDADFVVITDDFQVVQTYCRGRLVYDRERDLDIFNQEFLRKYKIS